MIIVEMSTDQIIRLLVFVAIIIGSVFWYFSMQARLGRIYKINAQITAIDERIGREREKYLVFIVTYPDEMNNQMQCEIIPGDNSEHYKIGDKIEVNFDPQNPKTVSHDHMDQLIAKIPFALIAAMLIGLGFLADELYGLF